MNARLDLTTRVAAGATQQDQMMHTLEGTNGICTLVNRLTT